MSSNSLDIVGTFPRGFSRDTKFAWPLVRADQLVTLNYGKALVERDRNPGKVPVYGTNGRCGWHNEGLVQGPGVILGRKGMGLLGVEWCDSDYWVIDTAYYVTPNTPNLDLKFFYYLTKYVGLNHLKDRTSNPSLSRDTFSAQLVPFPPLEVQRNIAHILGTLDDKIELNQQMNRTLEGIARALFKSWFIDFDPVRAKLDGRQPYGMDAETAALFPDSFEDSTLGKIPKGWITTSIEELADRVAMGPFGSNIKVSTFVPEGIPIISGQHLNGTLLEDKKYNFITLEHAEKLNKSNVYRGDIIFTHAGSVGQVALIPETSRYNRYVLSQHQFYMRCDRSKISPLFMIYFFKTPEGQHKLLANTSSTGVPSISRPVTYLRSIKVTIPAKQVSDAFEGLIQPLLLLIGKNIAQANTLITTRDLLLLKLLSGEIRVKEAEQALEAVV